MKYHFSCYARIKQSSKYVSFIICDANHVYIFFFYIVCLYPGVFSMDSFMAVAFDSGGVTTGPITVPFIMALGIGMAHMRNSHAEEDSFGLVALGSIGPILAVLLLGILYHPKGLPIRLFRWCMLRPQRTWLRHSWQRCPGMSGR